MNKQKWYWIGGLSIVGLLICAVVISLALFVTGLFSGGSAMAFGDAVAIVSVKGVILPGEAPPFSPFGGTVNAAYSQTVIDQLDQAVNDKDVKAIILYVDSPGGSVFASDEIAKKIGEIEKPIITSMGSLAASGGYYIAAPTDEIWASTSTLTCSIGVISQFLNVEGFAKKYGITTITVKSGKFKDMGNPFRKFTKDDEQLWQTIIDEMYAQFVTVVAKGRSMKENDVRAIADGRVCSGTQAIEMGLVDEIGYLPDVIDRATKLGGIEGEARIINYAKQPGFFSSLGANMSQPSPATELKNILNYHPGSPLMYLYTGQ